MFEAYAETSGGPCVPGLGDSGLSEEDWNCVGGDEGRTFLHEQPAYATSWVLPEIRKVMREEGVDVWQADQCMYGLRTWGRNKSISVPAKKLTRIMTNSRALGMELKRRCSGEHAHQTLVDGRAKDAARYPT